MAKSGKDRAERAGLDLHDVARSFAVDPRKCLRNEAAQTMIREYHLAVGILNNEHRLFEWHALVSELRVDGRLAERWADLLAGYCLVRDMESQVKGVQQGGLGHGPVSLGRAFRKKLTIQDASGKTGMVSTREVLGTPDFTPAVTAQLKTRLLAEMYKDLDSPQYEKGWVREVIQEAWQLVEESIKQESISRVLRRHRNRHSK